MEVMPQGHQNDQAKAEKPLEGTLAEERVGNERSGGGR